MHDFVEMFLDLTGSLATSITLGITIITSASLLLVNVARYFQAKKYGIPLSMINQASLPDSLDLWLILITSFGFGWLVPSYVTNMDINIFLAFGIAYVSVFVSIALMRNKAKFSRRNEKGSEMILSMNLGEKISKIALVSLLVASLFSYVGFANRQWVTDYEFTGNMFFNIVFQGASIILRIYLVLVVVTFVVSIIAKVYGDNDVMTVDIDGRPYLLATRHSQYQWILMTCVIEKNADEARDEGYIVNNSGDRGSEYIIKFTKGKFIIRDMSALEGHCPVVCRKGYGLQGVTEEDSVNTDSQSS